MAVSFFKKSFSAAYGYQNKISNPDTVEEEEDDDEEASDDQEQQQSESDSDAEAKSDNKRQTMSKLSKSISAYEIVSLAKKNLIDKLSTNVTKLSTYDHHSLLKSIQKDEESNQEDDDDEYEDSEERKEIISFNPYEQEERNLKLKMNEPLSLINPTALPILVQQQIIDEQNYSDKDSEEDESDESNSSGPKIDFTKYDEYGFIKRTKKETSNEVNLLKLNESDGSVKSSEERLGELEKVEKAEKKKEDDRLKSKWLTYLELTYNQIDEPSTKWYQIERKIKHTPKLDKLIELGVPHFLRNQLWLRFSDAYLMKEKCEFTYSQLCKKSNHIKNLNDKQSLRILQNNICFQDPMSKVNQSLRRILRVIKWVERNGVDLIANNLETINLPLICGYLLLIQNEEDVFWLLLSILNEWKLIFTNKSLLFNKSNNNDLIKTLIKKYCTKLDEKLNQEEIDLNLLINSWFTSLFADAINDTNILFYLYDLYFYHGFIVIFQLTFGLLLSKQDELIKLNSSVELINTISSLPDELTTNEKLLEIWKLGKNNLENLDQEFYTIKNQNELQGELLRIGVPAVKLFNENTSGIKLLPSSSSLNRLSDLNSELKYKNVKQSAILMELHESIASIAQHFQSNDSELKFNLTINYDLKKVNKIYKTHKSKLNKDKINKKEKCKRARAIIDFKRIDDDELGFRKNDIIKILDDRDEHCWIGELNEQHGTFPSKFVEILNENYGSYNEFGDDTVTPFINDLVRGRLCAVIKCIFNHGKRESYFFTVHPWMILTCLTKNYVKTQQNNICSKLVLTKTFKLDDFENNMNVKELFYKSIMYIDETHADEPMDVKLRSLICVALNHKLLAEWFTIYCMEDKNLIKKNYHDWAYVCTPVWHMIKLEFRLLKQFSFNLNPNAELISAETEPSSASKAVSKAVVRDMLVKYHLFSWDI